MNSIINLKCDQNNEQLFKVDTYTYSVLNASLYGRFACYEGCPDDTHPLQCALAGDGCS